MIPNIFGNVLAKEGEFIVKLMDSRGKTHKVHAFRLNDGSCLLSGLVWTKFVKSYPYKEFGTLCFTLKENYMFGVQVYCSGGLEYRRMMYPGDSPVNSQLVLASNYTLYQVVLSACFLFKLNRNHDHDWQVTTVVYGRKQIAEVSVTYHHYELDGRNGRMAIGFEGVGWNNFCSMNNILPGNILKFTRNLDLSFKVEVFESNGSVKRVHDEVFNDRTEIDCYSSSSEDEEILETKYHKCRYPHAAHSRYASHCIQVIQHRNVEMNQLILPKSFVVKHKLVNYDSGVLHFGELVFPFHLIPIFDGTTPGNVINTIMIMDWIYFMGQTGVEEDDWVRFQFNPDDNVVGETLHLDVC